MVKMVLGSSDAQGQTMSSVGKARVTAYNSAVTALSNFNGAGDLQGSAYDSGKQYGVSVITIWIQPYLKEKSKALKVVLVALEVLFVLWKVVIMRIRVSCKIYLLAWIV